MRHLQRILLVLCLSPLVIAQNKYGPDIQALNPLGFWPFAGNGNDLSGHGNPGAPMNGLQFTTLANPPQQGQAAVFGSNQHQYLAFGNASIFNLNGLHPITAMAWIKTENQTQGSEIIMGKLDPVGTGWVLGIDNGELTAPAGSGHLLFGYFLNGQPVLGVESTISVNTGGWVHVVATYDGSGTAAGIHLYFTGIQQTTTTLAASLGNASITTSMPLTVGAAPDGTAAYEGNINGVALFGTVLTPAQILQIADDANTAKAVLPQFAFGGGWYSALYLSNQGPASVSFPVTFTADNGTPLNIAAINGSSTTVTIPAAGTTIIEAPNVGALQQGYVTMPLPVGVTGYALFRQSVLGVQDQEAVAPISSANGNITSLVYDDTNYVTAVAIVNPGTTSDTVNITVNDNAGNVLGTGTVTLAAGTKTAVTLRSVPGLGGVTGTRGTVHFSVTGGQVAVLGLRFNNTAFSSIPALFFAQLTRFIGVF